VAFALLLSQAPENMQTNIKDAWTSGGDEFDCISNIVEGAVIAKRSCACSQGYLW
jgi:hypothetical protein